MDGFKITEPGDVIDKLFVYRDKYHEKGKYLGFKNLHEHYSMSLGNCTDWSGFPMSGKTQFFMVGSTWFTFLMSETMLK